MLLFWSITINAVNRSANTVVGLNEYLLIDELILRFGQEIVSYGCAFVLLLLKLRVRRHHTTFSISSVHGRVRSLHPLAL